MAAARAVAGILCYGRRLGSPAWALGLGFALGCAASHLGDRLFRDPGFARGHVVDFIDFNGLLGGNVAGIFLVGAAVFLPALTSAVSRSTAPVRPAPPTPAPPRTRPDRWTGSGAVVAQPGSSPSL